MGFYVIVIDERELTRSGKTEVLVDANVQVSEATIRIIRSGRPVRRLQFGRNHLSQI